jgi:hypothetical protein
MTRVLSSACVVLALLVVGSRAGAAPKPAIAILGLEVYDNGSGIDPDTTKAAKELTAALRDRARAGTGPYAPAANGEKELIDEKLLNNCDSEAPLCMAAIGGDLGADLLMYGKIEKSAQAGQPIYKVSLKLLYVARKQLASSIVEVLPLAEATGVQAPGHARTWYSKLIGVTTGGTVVVKANIDRGTVLLDDETKGNLTSGALTLSGIPEGRHTLAIEAKDYQRYETSITVRTGETVPHSATLTELPKKTLVLSPQPTTVEGTVSTRPANNLWKPVFYGTLVAGAAAGGFSIYEWSQSKTNADKVKIGRTGGGRLDESDCGKQPSYDNDRHFQDACSNHKLEIVGAVVAGVFAVAALGTGYLAFIRERDHTESRTASGGHKKRREFAVTPIVSPDGGGATLRIDW